jgi:Heterokaryon incompatibility protein (HET)
MDTSGANKYIYQPLSYDHENCQPIRLLRILPGKPDTPICCQIFHSYLIRSESDENGKSNFNNKRPQSEKVPRTLLYNALSYVWGDAQDRVTIQVNRKDLSITRNLWIFLDRHRKTFLCKKKLRCLFWIDANLYRSGEHR